MNSRRTDIWEPCDCANCRRINEILQSGKKAGISLVDDYQPDMFPEDVDRNPDLFPGWPKISVAIIGGMLFLGALLGLLVIFSR
jgi:hypothetical protein